MAHKLISNIDTQSVAEMDRHLSFLVTPDDLSSHCGDGNFRVATCQGKVREKQNFLQVRELSGNFEKMSGNFGHLSNVREMSGNFVMAIKFF